MRLVQRDTRELMIVAVPLEVLLMQRSEGQSHFTHYHNTLNTICPHHHPCPSKPERSNGYNLKPERTYCVLLIPKKRYQTEALS